MIILEISAQENGAHRNNIFKGLNSAVDVPDGWIEVPESLESDVLSSLPFLDLQIENGKLVGITPTERPQPEEPVTEYTPLELTQQDITDRELDTIELGQSMTDLELMIMEGYHV